MNDRIYRRLPHRNILRRIVVVCISIDREMLGPHSFRHVCPQYVFIESSVIIRVGGRKFRADGRTPRPGRPAGRRPGRLSAEWSARNP
jgi:hypothetical protein